MFEALMIVLILIGGRILWWTDICQCVTIILLASMAGHRD
jgi:hypothetical protein